LTRQFTPLPAQLVALMSEGALFGQERLSRLEPFFAGYNFVRNVNCSHGFPRLLVGWSAGRSFPV
jgi:hypothetical protein